MTSRETLFSGAAQLNPAAIFINHVLAQQPWAREELARHAGRSLRLAAPPFALGLKISDQGEVSALPPGSAAADVTLSVAATRVPFLFIDPETAMKDVRIEGDAELAQTLARLAREVRWDVEEDLSRVLGDIPAHQMMRFARAFAAWGREAGRRFAETTGAYFVDESPTLVRRDAAEAFGRDVAALRDDQARLEKRLELLEKARRG
ncbi:MAG TPA: SCP2 sterol-binding domain-containing protein [Burkholderiales bacterium]|jgi:ubiquinone biosynthesis protein UbiJ|nr:SCP2 sterol-binding domain-containing protein [Burkholderiales bacterium]